MPDDGLGRAGFEALHLMVAEGRRFCVLHVPGAGVAQRGSVLYVHPFAEEMNKSRRMAALQSRALAAAGWTVLQVDLAGCGDSDGEFADASWEHWIDDVVEAAAWLRKRSGCAPWLWGLRAGCLVAAEAARRTLPSPDLLFWQPVTSGRQFLQQFLRLKVAAQILGSADATRVDTRELQQRLFDGHAIEVAGYEISPALGAGLAAADLAPPSRGARVAWIEVGGAAELSPAARVRVEVWRAAGHAVDVRRVAGQAFWQTQEITECPALIEETLAALAAERS